MTHRHPARAATHRPRRRAAAHAGLELALAACEERKALDGLVLDLRDLSDAADYFVIVSGTSDTHVRAIADHIIATLQTADLRPYHVEGLSQGRWVLVDCVDFVVHVFHPTLRAFYQLEGLWGDAPQRRLTP